MFLDNIQVYSSFVNTNLSSYYFSLYSFLLQNMFHSIILVICLIFAHLYNISAVCPNLCSGHGVCTNFDLCSCLVGPDGDYAWTGYDCSLRTCPK